MNLPKQSLSTTEKVPDPAFPVMVRNRLFIKGLVATIVLLLSILVLSVITGTQSVYVDIVNGNVKCARKALGLTYSVKTKETAYSLLVTRFGLQDNPDWRLAGYDEMRDFWGSGHRCFKAGKSIVAMEALARLVELNEIDNPPDKIRHLRLLLKEKDPTAAWKYIQDLSKQLSEQTTANGIKGEIPLNEP